MEPDGKATRKDLLGIQEPGDHKHRAAEKPPALGTFPNELEVEVCKCGARRFAHIGSGPASGWFIWASKSKQYPL